MKLSDFCDDEGVVRAPAKITGLSVHLVSGEQVLSLEQWAEKRAQILVSRRFLIVDDTLAQLSQFSFHNPFLLLPGMWFEVLVDAEVRDLVRFEFDGRLLSPTECLKLVEAGT